MTGFLNLVSSLHAEWLAVALFQYVPATVLCCIGKNAKKKVSIGLFVTAGIWAIVALALGYGLLMFGHL